MKKGLKFCCCCIVIVVYEKQCRCYFLLKSIMEDQTSEILSLNFTAMELSSNVLCPFLVWGLRSGDETVIGNGRVCICLNHQKLRSRLASLSAGSKLWSSKAFLILRAQARHTRSDDVSDLCTSTGQFQISDKVPFWANLTLRGLEKVCISPANLIFSGQQRSLQ